MQPADKSMRQKGTSWTKAGFELTYILLHGADAAGALNAGCQSSTNAEPFPAQCTSEGICK